jgi:transcription elongation factor Elf1
MSDNYPDGSMMGSGIYAEEFVAEDFDCVNPECGKENVGVVVVTDDWGRYEINCEFCEASYRDGSLGTDDLEYYDDPDDYNEDAHSYWDEDDEDFEEEE